MEAISLESPRGDTKFDHLIGESEDEKEEEVEEPITIRARFTRLLDVCGWRFLVFLVFSQFACKGLLMIIVKNIMLPLFRNNTDASTFQIYVMVVMIPWSIKPLIGLCSDYILIFGYHKRGWLLISLVLGSICSSLLFVFNTPVLLVLCFVGINFEIALYDLLSEGKYAEIRRKYKNVGSDLTTFTQALQMGGLLIGTAFVGILSDAGLYVVLYIMTLVFCLAPLGPTLLGWMPEKKVITYTDGVPKTKIIHISEKSDFQKDWPLIVVVSICGLGGLVMSILTTTIPSPVGPFVGLGVGLIFLAAILYGSNWAFKEHPLITSVALYQVVTALSSPVIGSELDYFYTATPECLPNGPHFSYDYYISYTGIVGTALGLLGTFVYYFLLSKHRFRPVLLVTTVLVCLAGLSDLFIVLRWNILFGIPDKLAYMTGEAVLEPLLGTLNWIPVSALIVLAAPKGKESSCFAFLAGLSNFARMISELSGSIIIHFTSNLISTESGGGGANCDFSALWWLVLLCHISFPLVIGALATWLIPDIEQTEQVE